MDYFSEEEISTFFERNNNHYMNSNGMRIGLSEEKGVWTFLTIDNEESEFGISIATEEDSLQDFVTGFKLKTWRDIDQLSYNNSWMRYLNGHAVIIINPLELDVDISFKIVKSKTIVFSLDIHFYDEVYEHLTMPEDFQKYLSDHERRLWAAYENRYRVR